MNRQRSWRRAWRILSCLVVLSVGAVVVGFVFDEQLLRVSQEAQSADVIVVLGGEPNVRVQVAAQLAEKALAPRIILSGTGDCEVNRDQLSKLGVRTNMIELECASTSTQENAVFTIKLLRQHGCERVIIVTSWYHSRRALSCFRHYAPEIDFLSVPAPRTQIWKYERNYIAAEYAKMLVYAVRFGILPWENAAVESPKAESRKGGE